MLNLLLQNAPRRRGAGFTAIFRHLGALGLFLLAILDSSPLPTFAGPDILIAILAVSHRDPWYEYVAATVAGSVIGAYLTFRLARRAGSVYLDSKFGKARVQAIVSLFEQWETGILIASTAIPFPFPTSMFFAAAGASNYPMNRFLVLVAVCRAVRYTAIALVADHYGRAFIRLLRHPMQHSGWLIFSVAIVAALALTGILADRRLKRDGGAGASAQRPAASGFPARTNASERNSRAR